MLGLILNIRRASAAQSAAVSKAAVLTCEPAYASSALALAAAASASAVCDEWVHGRGHAEKPGRAGGRQDYKEQS